VEKSKFTMFWISLSRPERLVIAIAMLVFLVVLVIASEIIPKRSFSSIAAGFLLLTASTFSLAGAGWLVMLHLIGRCREKRNLAVAVVAGLAGAVPVLVVTIRLLTQG